MTGDVAERLDALVAEQDGWFTAAQALDIGYRSDDIDRNVAGEVWTRVEDDLLRPAGRPRRDLDEYSKWCVWLGSTAVISHQSAAELHGMGSLHPQFVHLRVSGVEHAHDPRIAFHRGRLSGGDIELSGAVRLTTPVRTVLDLAAGGISQFTLDEVVADGLVLGRLTVDELFEQAVECGDRVAVRVEAALR